MKIIKYFSSIIFYSLLVLGVALTVISVQAQIFTSPKNNYDPLTTDIWQTLIDDLTGLDGRITAIEQASWQNISITTEYLSCQSGDNCMMTRPLGRHKFCALAGYSGPGGYNTKCRIQELNGSYSLYAEDTSESGQTHGCKAVCFD